MGYVRCKEEGCTKRPSFNLPGVLPPRYCAKHRHEGMQDVRNRRCTADNCGKQPNFAAPGDRRPQFCALHARPDMVDVLTRKCDVDGCAKIPSYAPPEAKMPQFCAGHRQLGMVDKKHRSCDEPGCTRRGAYAAPGAPPQQRFCTQHRRAGMRDALHKNCEAPGCTSRPRRTVRAHSGGPPLGAPLPRFCARHERERPAVPKAEAGAAPAANAGSAGAAAAGLQSALQSLPGDAVNALPMDIACAAAAAAGLPDAGLSVGFAALGMHIVELPLLAPPMASAEPAMSAAGGSEGLQHCGLGPLPSHSNRQDQLQAGALAQLGAAAGHSTHSVMELIPSAASTAPCMHSATCPQQSFTAAVVAALVSDGDPFSCSCARQAASDQASRAIAA